MDDIYSLTTLYDEQHQSFTEDFPMHRTLAATYGSSVLELGAGNARVGLDLASAGCEVCGIDLSADMVAFAQEKARTRSVPVSFAQGDMASFDGMKLFGRGFDLVICPFNTLCHLHDPEKLAACLDSVRSCLGPGGVFAPSIFVPNPVFLEREPGSLRLVDEFWSESYGQSVEIYERNDYNRLTQINNLDWFFAVGDEMLQRSFELRVYYPQELRYLIRNAGFEIIEEWADYETRLIGSAAIPSGLPSDTIAQTIVCRPV